MPGARLAPGGSRSPPRSRVRRGGGGGGGPGPRPPPASAAEPVGADAAGRADRALPVVARQDLPTAGNEHPVEVAILQGTFEPLKHVLLEGCRPDLRSVGPDALDHPVIVFRVVLRTVDDERTHDLHEFQRPWSGWSHGSQERPYAGREHKQ